MRYQSVIGYERGYECQNPVKKKEIAAFSWNLLLLKGNHLKADLWTAKKLSSTKHSSIIHPATIHSSAIQTSSIHPPSTHHISCTRFPSRQTALMAVSGHQTLSNLKRIRVQQLQNKSSHVSFLLPYNSMAMACMAYVQKSLVHNRKFVCVSIFCCPLPQWKLEAYFVLLASFVLHCLYNV